VVAERWNKPIEIERSEGVAVIVSGETSIRPLHSKEIKDKLSNDLSYYDEDLFLASPEGVLILGCDDYNKTFLHRADSDAT